MDIVKNECDNADTIAFGLVVYSFKSNKSWRITHNYFYPDPLNGNYKIRGLNFQWPSAGLIGLALGRPSSEGYVC